MDGLKIEVFAELKGFVVQTKGDKSERCSSSDLNIALVMWQMNYGKKYGVTDKEFTIVLPWAEQDQ